MKTFFLGLDCTGETYSVGLWSPKGPCLEASGFTARRALRDAPAAIESVLGQAGISATDLVGIGLTEGPGSFTGVRLGVAIVKTLALVAECPVIAWDTLELLAHQSLGTFGAGRVAVALDARRGELYGAVFSREKAGEAPLTALLPTGVYDPTEFSNQLKSLGPFQAAIGGGFAAYPQILGADWLGPRLQGTSESAPRGRLIAYLSSHPSFGGRRVSGEDLWPVYCRRADIQVSQAGASAASGDGSPS